MAKKIITLELPALYGDHHVTEVRRILLEIPGVQDVYASSGFQMAEVEVEDSVTEDALKTVLEKAGYLGELPVAEEIEVSPAEKGGKSALFRHSALYEQTREAVSFTQEVENPGKALWPCPGMGPIERMDE